MMQDGDRDSAEMTNGQSAMASPSRHVGVDVRSRDAFELLKLGEAIVNLQSDLRRLQLEKEDLRFDRNRYQASAVQYQEKLLRALNELDQARSNYEETRDIRREVVGLAREFAKRLECERNKISEDIYEERRQHDLEVLRAELKAEYDNRLRHEIVSLARECAAKLVNQEEEKRYDAAALRQFARRSKVK
jgi:hypothetical protein